MFDKIFYSIEMRLETNPVFVTLLLDRDSQSDLRPTAFPGMGLLDISDILVDVSRK